MTIVTMHLLFGVLIGAIVFTVGIFFVLINALRVYTRRLDEMDKLIRELHKQTDESDQVT